MRQRHAARAALGMVTVSAVIGAPAAGSASDISAGAGEEVEAGRRPNVVMIVVDDLGYDQISLMVGRS